ncbi:hypothetical protein CPT_Stahl45 [Bacillus phage Stahl]|uniref:Uncharacterized protein n=1 Tax=Bacillus phage Stahl TaxID=1610832 RepID=A0A0E3JT35_9CAUD|nr:hypothetical protein CPT_Stahl45 [Bacillus phage Stahl]AKA61473.1 hypothetical protein CPT_Stahl45 [Bacillus phage Stahl]
MLLLFFVEKKHAKNDIYNYRQVIKGGTK